MARANDRKEAKDREKEKVRESANDGVIDPDDADAIIELAQFEDGEKADSTIRNHTLQARVFAERADKPLLEMSQSDVENVLNDMKTGRHPEVKDGGIKIRGYQATLRVFFNFHEEKTDVDGNDIDLDETEGRDMSVDDLLYGDEVESLLNTCRRKNPRDMALIAMLLATGQRIDAVRTLRLKHVTVDGPTMEVQLNTDEGALKGASGAKPLLWGKHYVRPWYESHPHKGDPEAALFCVRSSPGNGIDGEQAKEPMSDDTLRATIRRRAHDAGIDKRVYPHLLRHTAITRMVIEGLSEQKIKRIVGWSPDSSQFGTYVHLAEELTTDSVRRELGLPTSNTGTPQIGAPPLDSCPECRDEIPEGKERCPTCNTPFTQREAEEGEPQESVATDPSKVDVSAMDDDEKMELIDALRDEIRG